MQHIIRHFATITRHRHKVIQHCFKAGIPLRGLLHDLSKYSPAEFLRGCKYYQGNRSPNDREREVNGYSASWMHHKGRNKHHFEYWTDYDHATGLITAVKMPTKYLIEMFCDRVAASKIYSGDKYSPSNPLAFFLRAKGRRFINADTSEALEFLLNMLKEKGEDETFAYIRRIDKNKDYSFTDGNGFEVKR